ncbi:MULTISPECIES: protease modulator HflC [Paenibacillus]|uniref:Protein HflC n=1 Tax=Paenibacillus vandeheii TaxID=3035917 RepID=A0ABT8JFP9_9BACL|nr:MULTISPECIES: protease modulator HflC [Paenibacillus]KGP81368.1 tail fiber protein [Paenibacillus sp. MAEPY1]KGP82004.1 tail fiber protein [Paenibacillus sp. MAEPY2]MDN4603925.1 protease modulator HflC [Paenibacillus vandeheii]
MNVTFKFSYKSWFLRLTIILILGAFVMMSLFTFKVKENEYAVVTRFGEIVRVQNAAGLKLKVPLIEKITRLPKEQKIYTSKSTSILTKDKKPMMVDNYTVWRISSVNKFLKSVQTVKSGEERIDAAVYNTVRRKLSESEYGAIINTSLQKNASGSRNDLNASITTEVRNLMEENYGISIVDIKIKTTDLPEENKQSVYKRMISERDSIAANYLSEGEEEAKKKTSEADREARIIESEGNLVAQKTLAEGEQEAARIYNEAYSRDTEFYDLYRTLQSYVTSLQGEPVIMIPADSPYASILTGKTK